VTVLSRVSRGVGPPKCPAGSDGLSLSVRISRLRCHRSDRASSGHPTASPKVRCGLLRGLDRHPDLDPRCLVTVLSRVSRGVGPPKCPAEAEQVATRASEPPPAEAACRSSTRLKQPPKPLIPESAAFPPPTEVEDRPALESRPAIPPPEGDHHRSPARDPGRSRKRLSLTSVCRPRRPKPPEHPTAESRPIDRSTALPPTESVGPSGFARLRVAAGCFAAPISTFALSGAVLIGFLEAASRSPKRSNNSPLELHYSLGVRTFSARLIRLAARECHKLESAPLLRFFAPSTHSFSEQPCFSTEVPPRERPLLTAPFRPRRFHDLDGFTSSEPRRRFRRQRPWGSCPSGFIPPRPGSAVSGSAAPLDLCRPAPASRRATEVAG
jgi:hypothetical protein